ncbi:complement component 1 Q subcomponent-binding protein, mitochondrial-like [Bolinopsis microptera]|uniref:complement component 1 Q subcomponent-binding protein, mitochondrial-like n=1 Tax=Bolinopsis microptera TaxID=2820187 RepID=UPI0030799F29
MNTVLRSMCRASGLANKLCRLPKSNVPNLIPSTLRHSVATIPQVRHMSNDSTLMSALNNEILHEEGAVSYDSAPSAEPSDFTRSVNGATIILQKQYNNETIRVELDLNNNTELAPAEDDPEENPPQYLPSFKIEISKPQGKLVFSCNYHMTTEEQNLDQFVISEVAFAGPGEDDHVAFTTDFGNLDYVLIEEFENYLTRRGLDAEFSSTLFEMSAAFEHHNYVNFLKNVRDFVN